MYADQRYTNELFFLVAENLVVFFMVTDFQDKAHNFKPVTFNCIEHPPVTCEINLPEV